MGRHVGKKVERKEKSKVKLRTKNAGISKAKNNTDTTFKSHKILLREQLHNKDLCVPYSKRKLTVKELLSRLQHHNVSARQSALVDLRELVQSNRSEEILRSRKGKILEEIAKLILDQEREVRKSAMKLLEEILGQVETQQLSPYFKMLLSYLGCSLTHIHPNIQEDGLMLLDALLKAAPSLVAENACQILPNFLNMISRLKSESKPERTLTMNLGSPHIIMKWRFNVLCYMHNLLTAMVEHYRSKRPKEASTESSKTYFWTENKPLCVPAYKSYYFKLCRLSDSFDISSSSSDTGKLKNFADVLMPLLRETWLEALPSDTKQKSTLSMDTALLLKCMVEIIQLLWELLLLWERKEDSTILSTEFAAAYRKDFETHFLRGFPYIKANNLVNEWGDLYVKTKQQQQQQPKQKTSSMSMFWKDKTVDENCSEINLKLCSLFCSLHDTENPPADICASVVEYTKGYMNTLQRNEHVVSELMPLVRTLLMKHGQSWKWLEIDFASLMDVVLMCTVHVRPPYVVVEALTQVLCEVAVSKKLQHLHRSPMFLSWLCSLPEVLLRPTVHITVLKAIVELAYESERFMMALHVILNRPSALENFDKIKVTGVSTDHEGKIHLISLLYCLRKHQQSQRGFWNDKAAVSLAELLLPHGRV